MRRCLTVKYATNMGNTFQECLIKCVLDDPAVLFHWYFIGHVHNELGERCLNQIADKWITITGFLYKIDVRNVQTSIKKEQQQSRIYCK